MASEPPGGPTRRRDVADDTRFSLSTAAPARSKVSHAIINSLRAEIASGNLPLGARLPSEKVLAAQFGVSQPTVREAVRALEAMGLLTIRHGSGVYVARSTSDFITSTMQTLLQMEQVRMLEAFEVRRTLGELSAVRAVRHATEADILRLEETARACDDARDVRGVAEAIVEFQVAFSAAAHNPLLFALETFLVRLLMQFQLHANGSKSARYWRGRAEAFTDHRHAMVAALRKSDLTGLVESWGSYLDAQREFFESDPRLSTIALSEPEAIRTVNEIALTLPTYDIGR